jgi:hypothetical protein
MTKTNVQICRGFTIEQWMALGRRLDKGDAAAWLVAVEVFERRIRERFLSSIEALLQADSGIAADVEVTPGAPADGSSLPATPAVVPGFAIVALSCLLIETLQSFFVAASTDTQGQFKAFLQRASFGGAFSNSSVAESFSRGVRNGILHEGETRGWVLWRAEPVVGLVQLLPGGRYALNRTAFYHAVKREFEEYCAELKQGNVELRRCLRIQMEDMLSKS